jgi:hypothetical protein
MVPTDVTVSTEVPLVPKIPGAENLQHGSSNAVTEVTKVEEPPMKIAALNIIVDIWIYSAGIKGAIL